MFWDNFERICKESGTSPSRACVEVGIGQNRPSNWKKSGTLPKQDELEVLANHLGCTVADFFKDEESRDYDTLTKLFTKRLSSVDEDTLERGKQFLLLTTLAADGGGTNSEYYKMLQKKLVEYRNAQAHGIKASWKSDDDEEAEQEVLPIDVEVEDVSPSLDDYERDFIRIYEALDPKTRIKLMNAVYVFDPEGGEQ